MQALLESYRRFAERAVAAGIDPTLLEEARATEQNAELDGFLDAVPDALEGAASGLQRIADMARAMQDVARAAETRRGFGDLVAIVRGVRTAARNEYRYVADVELELGAVPAFACGAGATGQALLALLLAAADAIRTAVAGTYARGVIRIRSSVDGPWAVICVEADVAAPTSVEAREVAAPRLDETNPVTQRRLALARAVAIEHAGSLTIESTAAGGAACLLRFPLQHAGEAASESTLSST